MLSITGKYSTAKVFIDSIDQETEKQIRTLCDQAFVRDSKIRIMPDCHAGAGCVIGTTMTISDKVVPNLVGVDIGCGVLAGKLATLDVDLRKLDQVIRKRVPSGSDVRKFPHPLIKETAIRELIARDAINIERAVLSCGTLGGGNHFIEVSRNGQGELYVCIHSGSRHLGKQIAEHYQKKAAENQNAANRKNTIETLKSAGREQDIQTALAQMSDLVPSKGLEYLEGENLKDYLHDIGIVQAYAMMNRQAILEEIAEGMGLDIESVFQTIHNYIDVGQNILRKGAISAKAGEKVIIPLNMRDGSLLAMGKGNPDWNYSAPHGAGRIISRSEAKRRLALDEFRKSMMGIYSTSVSKATLDESPMAYKPAEQIVDAIQDTVEVFDQIRPIYNFKAP